MRTGDGARHRVPGQDRRRERRRRGDADPAPASGVGRPGDQRWRRRRAPGPRRGRPSRTTSRGRGDRRAGRPGPARAAPTSTMSWAATAIGTDCVARRARYPTANTATSRAAQCTSTNARSSGAGTTATSRALQRPEVGHAREAAEVVDGRRCRREPHPVLVGRRRQRERRAQVAHHPGEHPGVRPGLRAADPPDEHDDRGHDRNDPGASRAPARPRSVSSTSFQPPG